jgi:flagellar hook-length control protein FliK
MQTTTLPIQVTGAAPSAPRQPTPNGDAAQFTAALSREMEQRRSAASAASAHATQQGQAARPKEAPDSAGQQAAPDAAAATQDPAKAQAPASDARADDSTAKDGEGQASDQKAASSPVTDLIALMASFTQLHKAGAAADTKESPQGIDSKGAGQQAGALQAALKRVVRDGADTAQGKAGVQASEALEGAAAQVDPGAARSSPDVIDLGAAATGAALARARSGSAEPATQLADFAARLDAAKAQPDPAPLAAAPQFQAAALEAAKAAGAAGDKIGARVGSPGWDNQVGQKIVWMVADGEQSASLTLNPPDLGPMQVVLNVSGDQASVAFSSSHEEVRHALENALPRLREMMSESGIALGNATVSAGMPDQRQAQGGQGGNASGSHGGARMANGTAAGEAAPAAVARTTVLGGNGMVDTFA